MSTREDRIKGVLLGQAAGDALGAGYETGRKPEGKARMIGGGFGFEPGEWTDDTDQAIVVASARSDPLKVADGLLGWFNAGPRDVGGTTAQVLARCEHPGDLAAMSRGIGEWHAKRLSPPGWDPGMANGSLMRTGPVCLPFLGERDRIAAVAREISELTHFDPYAGDACVLWSLAIDRAVDLAGFDRVVVGSGLGFIPVARQDFWAHLIIEVTDSDLPRREYRRNGSAVGAFKAALHAVAHAGSLEDGLQRAVAIGGDTDTVAAIAGALLGAIYGVSAIPGEWYRVLHGWSPSGRIRAWDLERIALEAAS